MKTDEERKPVLERWNMLKGQGQQQKDNKLIPFKQHEVVDAKGNVTQQAKDYFLDPETRQTIDPMANMQSSAPYQDGQELRGKDGKIYIVKNGQPILKA